MEIIQSKMKKTIAFIMLAIMLISLATPVFAATANATPSNKAATGGFANIITSIFSMIMDAIRTFFSGLSKISINESKSVNQAEQSAKKVNNVNTKGNMIDVSKSVVSGKKYTSLTDQQKKQLAYLAYKEQGSLAGAKIELSLMANLAERKGYTCVYKYAIGTGKNSWFGPVRRGEIPANPSISKSYVDLVEEVLVKGKRYLPKNVVEHDCFSDIKKIEVNGVAYSNIKDIKNKNNYIPNKTIIYNKYGSTYVFYGFAPNGGDPFGYFK